MCVWVCGCVWVCVGVYTCYNVVPRQSNVGQVGLQGHTVGTATLLEVMPCLTTCVCVGGWVCIPAIMWCQGKVM